MCETYIQKRLAEFGNERRPDFTLDRLRAALGERRHPERKTRCLLIGGTNGKGSTSLLVSAALRSHGLDVRTYSSPHLVGPQERFLHNLFPISPDLLWELMDALSSVGKAHRLSYFEFLTLVFFEWCAREKTDYAIVEVGLGGKLDATNLCEPFASVLTNVDLDHQEYLGNTRELILEDKIRISRPGRTLYTGIDDPALLVRATAYCSKQGTLLKRPGSAEVVKRDWSGQELRIEGALFSLRDPSAAAALNAALAYCVVRGEFPEISVANIQKGFGEVIFPGRFELLSEKPTVVLCGAHNPHGIQSLVTTLHSLPQARPLRILCAFSSDKPYRDMLALLQTVCDDLCVTENKTARNAGPLELPAGIAFEADLVSALARQRPASDKGVLLITGSLYLIGEVRKLLDSEVRFVQAPATTGPPSFREPDGATPATAR